MSEPDDAEQPPSPPPFAPEDGAYAAIVSEFYGLQRAGMHMLGAALTTAAEIIILKLVNGPQEQPPAE